MDYDQIIFSGHAVRQMFHREITKNDIIGVVNKGQVIIDYPDDKPYLSCLMLGFVNNRPIHVVLAIDKENKTGIIITVYIPDSKLWNEDFKSRRNNK